MVDLDQLAQHLGVPVGSDRLPEAAAAASAWVESRRSNTDPADLWQMPDVMLGAVMYAGLLFTSRAQPQGFPGFDELGRYSEDTGMAMANIYRLVGADPVTA